MARRNSGISIYGYSGSSKKSKPSRVSPIDSVRARIVLVVFGIIMILLGVYFRQVEIFFQSTPIEGYVFASLVITAGFLQFLTLGIRRIYDVTKLRGFTNEQFFTFWVTIGSVLIAVLNILGFVNTFGVFANGILITQGALISLEALRNTSNS